MSYIGQGLPADTFQGFTTDSFTGDGSATTFTLSKEPFSEDTLIVVINNVIQQPGTNFTVSGTTLTIVGTAVANGDPIYAIHMGGPLPIGGASELDLNGASDKLILDADADTTISADTDDQIDFKLGGVDEMTMSSSGIVINEGSNDRDFRVEGNGNTHALFIRGSDDHVGINEDAPDCRFHIKETNDTSFSIDNFTNIDNSILKLENASTTNDAFVNMSFRTGDGMDLFFGGVQDSSDGNGGAFVFGRQDSTDVELLRIATDGDIELGAGNIDSSSNDLIIYSDTSSHCGIRFALGYAGPVDSSASSSGADGAFAFGASAYRWATIYATTGTINTSDKNEKQDIEELTDAEKRVAVAAKGLLRKYKWKDAVEEKGDKARTHFGIIAQDLEDAFTAEGLDASNYGMFCSDTWWEKENEEHKYEETEGYTKKTRLGVRYDQVLAFIIGGI